MRRDQSSVLVSPGLKARGYDARQRISTPEPRRLPGGSQLSGLGLERNLFLARRIAIEARRPLTTDDWQSRPVPRQSLVSAFGVFAVLFGSAGGLMYSGSIFPVRTFRNSTICATCGSVNVLPSSYSPIS